MLQERSGWGARVEEAVGALDSGVCALCPAPHPLAAPHPLTLCCPSLRELAVSSITAQPSLPAPTALTWCSDCVGKSVVQKQGYAQAVAGSLCYKVKLPNHFDMVVFIALVC